MPETEAPGDIYLSKLAAGTWKLAFEDGGWIIEASVFEEPNGVSCSYCKTEIEKAYNKQSREFEYVYFCPRDATFWHKRCLMVMHKVNTTTTNKEHEDMRISKIEWIVPKNDKT